MINEINLVCDRMQVLISESLSRVSGHIADKELQLKEAQASISFMENQSIPVPVELQDLERHLTKEISEDEDKKSLDRLRTQLIDLSQQLQRYVRLPSGGKSVVRRPYTHISEFYPAIKQAFADLGGTGDEEVLKEKVFNQMKDRFRPGDYDTNNTATSEVRWKDSVHWAIYRLISTGDIQKDENTGILQLTDTLPEYNETISM